MAPTLSFAAHRPRVNESRTKMFTCSLSVICFVAEEPAITRRRTTRQICSAGRQKTKPRMHGSSTIAETPSWSSLLRSILLLLQPILCQQRLPHLLANQGCGRAAWFWAIGTMKRIPFDRGRVCQRSPDAHQPSRGEEPELLSSYHQRVRSYSFGGATPMHAQP